MRWAVAALGAAAVFVPVAPLGATTSRVPSAATPTVSITSFVDGAAPFSSGDGAGEDSSPANGRVRAGDIVRLTVKVIPNGAAGGVTADDVVVDISVAGGLIAWSAAQPVGCTVANGGVNCNFAKRPVGTPIEFVMDGRAVERSSIGDLNGQVSVSTGGTPVAAPLVVTAAGPSIDAALTAPRFAGSTSRNGVDGVLVTYGVHLVSPSATAAVSVPGGTTLDVLFDASGAGGEVVNCSANGEPGQGFTFSAAVSDRHTAEDVATTTRVAAGGAWSCAPDGSRARITVSGVDTNPDSFPSQSWNQLAVTAGAGVVSAGAVTVFVPNATIGQGGMASVSLSRAAGTVEASANYGNCPSADTLAAGTCGAESTRQDPLTSSSVGPLTPLLTVFHTVSPPVAAPGASLVWRYTVTNTGNVAVAGVSATDSAAAGPTAPADGALDPGEVWAFTLEGTQTSGPLQSVVTVTGTASGGTPVSASHEVTSTPPPAAPPADAGIQVTPVAGAGGAPAIDAAPAISQGTKTTLTLYVNGVIFTALPGPVMVVGVDNLVEYEVKNKTEATITEVVVDDTSITNDATALDCGVDAVTKNKVAAMLAGSTVVCTLVVRPAAGNVTFTANVTVGGVADNTQPAGFQAKPAGIDLELTVNGQDADTAPGPSVTANSLLTFGYAIRNTGQVDLASVFVSHVDDDDGVFDEISCAAINGDTDGDAAIELLKVGQSVNCTFTPRAVVGAFATEAVVVGNAATAEGEDLANEEGSIELTDSDQVHYTGVSGGSTATTQPTTQTTVPGVIGSGGSNAWTIVLAGVLVFAAGFGLWSVARRRRFATR